MSILTPTLYIYSARVETLYNNTYKGSFIHYFFEVPVLLRGMGITGITTGRQVIVFRIPRDWA